MWERGEERKQGIGVRWVESREVGERREEEGRREEKREEGEGRMRRMKGGIKGSKTEE